MFLGQPNGAERQRDEPVEQAVSGESQFERATADVHDDRASDAEIEVRERATKREPRFFFADQRANPETGLGANEVQEGGSVDGIPRTAEVATASTRRAPSWAASVDMRPSASSASRMAVSLSSPDAVRPAPSLGAAFSSSTMRIEPFVDTLATICRIELDPISIAAMRRV